MPQLESKKKASTASGFGRYKAVKKKNGKYRVKDVEIFAEHTRRGKKFDSDWIDGAIKAAADRKEEQGYYPPLHVHHHYEGDEVKSAGTFIPTKRVERVYGGKPTQTLLADYDDVPEDVYNRMKKGELPYRSVEIHDPSKPEIDSLALLSHHVPYFRFRNLRVEEEASGEISYKGGRPILTYAADGPGVGLLFSFAEGSEGLGHHVIEPELEKYVGMPLAAVEDKPKVGAPAAPEQNPAGQGDGAAPESPEGPPAPAAPSPAEQAAKAKAEMVQTIVSALTSALQTVVSDLSTPTNPVDDSSEESEKPKSLQESDERADDEDRISGGPVTMSDVKKADKTVKGTSGAPPAPKDAVATELDKQQSYAAMRGEIAALKARVDHQDRTKELDTVVGAAFAGLAKYGLNDEAKTELREIAETDGVSGINAYVAAVKRYGVPDPGQDESELEIDKTELPEVQAYSASPEQLQVARIAATQYNSAPESLKRGTSRAAYVKAAVEGIVTN